MAPAALGTLLRHIQTVTAGCGVPQWTDRQLLDDFAARHDEAAFAALVSRHGPMVLQVCRRVLNHEQDAEDAFQATFLVLARNTGSIRQRDAVGSWLHGVAYRTAMKAKRSAARRRKHEARVPASAPRTSARPSWDDVQAVLDEEVQRLPARFREAFVLCVLEGKSRSEAGIELGCKEGTVKSRVNRARQALQCQLARRGISLAALLAALSVSETAGQAGMSAALADTTIHFGLLVAAGEPAAAVIPSNVAALAAGVTRAMFLTKAKIALAVLFAAAFVAAGAGLLAHHALAGGEPEKPREAALQPPTAKQATKPKADPKEEEKDAVTVAGRVLGPDGKPVAGARVYFVRQVGNQLEPLLEKLPVQATTGADGRFRFQVPREAPPHPDETPGQFIARVTAVTPGHGPGWSTLYQPENAADLTLKLVPDDVPITGRVVNLEGKPIKGVTVRVAGVTPMVVDESLDPLLGAVEKKPKKDVGMLWQFRRDVLAPPAAGLTVRTTTDADGRFRLTGAGRERIVTLRFDGPTIETRYVDVMTRPGQGFRLPPSADEPSAGAYVCQGADFIHAAAPTRPIVGTVRDKDTGKPIAGATLWAFIASGTDLIARDYVRATTDTEGRYRLVGLPGTTGQEVYLTPPAGQPYLSAGRQVRGAGLDPVRLDFDLKRGVTIRGRVTDKATGKPVRAQVEYFVFADNPHLNDIPGFRDARVENVYAAADGSFTLVGLPGRGVVAACVPGSQKERYVIASGVDKIGGSEQNYQFVTYPYILRALSWNALVEINPKRGDASVTCDVSVVPGATVTGRVLGPDGKPVAGVNIDGAWGTPVHLRQLPTAEFTLTAIDPQRPQPFFFRQREKNLGAALVVKGDEPKDFTVRLQPCAIITGRVLDADGRPVADLQLTGKIHSGQLKVVESWYGFLGGITDKDGRFRIAGVIPGVKVNLAAFKGAMITGALIPEATFLPGEEKDFGDLVLQPLQ